MTSPSQGPVHLGVLIPWANAVVEAELHQVTGLRVTWHYARLVPESRTTRLDGDFLTGLLSAVPEALGQLAALPLSGAYLACTSAAFMYPGRAMHAGQGAPVSLVSAFDALMTSVRELQASRIVLVTPYPEDVTAAEAAMFAARGIKMTASASLGEYDGYGTVTHSQVRGLVHSVGGAAIDKADAIVLSCTGWPTFSVIPELRQHLGKPVISSNLAIGQHALRRSPGDARPGG